MTTETVIEDQLEEQIDKILPCEAAGAQCANPVEWLATPIPPSRWNDGIVPNHRSILICDFHRIRQIQYTLNRYKRAGFVRYIPV